MKQILAAVLTLALIVCCIPGVWAEAEQPTEPAEITVTLNGAPLSFDTFRPELKDGRVFLPLRQVFEALGCDSGDILWDSETQTATATRWGVSVSLTLGSTSALVTKNGKTMMEIMDAAPYIKKDADGGGYVYVPLRFASQALGCTVDWDGNTRTVSITDDYLTAEKNGGFISFSNLEERVRTGNVTALYLEEQISVIEAVDYEKLQKDLLQEMNSLAEIEWYAIMMQNTYASNSLHQAYENLNSQYKDLRDGKIQKDAADAVRQLRNLQDQLLFGAESLYISIDEMLAQQKTLQRKLVSTERTVREMELRYSLGQISALSLDQVRGGYTSLLSSMESLNTGISLLKLQLEQFTGAELTGTSSLSP
ncbi:MAG: hypothetical protein IJ705_02160, partial [Oscillospiraceae bacterium]|nr:hypothetical protein [Oscillospiraceae bacterium]